MQSNFITWRIYRDRRKTPVPVLRAQGNEDGRQALLQYAFVPQGIQRGETAVVPAYQRAVGVYTLELWENSDHLPAEALAREPILLETQNGLCLARPLAFEGEGANPYLEPDVRFEAGEPILYVPGSETRGNGGEQLFIAAEIGRGVYRIPTLGTRRPQHVEINGGTPVPHFEYDPYHGVLLLLNDHLEPITNALATVTVSLDTTFQRPLGGMAPGVYPVVEQASGYVELGSRGDEPCGSSILGFVVIDRVRRYTDARRRAPVPFDTERFHRVGYGQLDGTPLSKGHLWIVETNAPPDRIADAVHRTLPAGSIVRLVPSTDTTAAPVAPPMGSYILTEDGAILSTEHDENLIR